jgi:hypothetical protein
MFASQERPTRKSTLAGRLSFDGVEEEDALAGLSSVYGARITTVGELVAEREATAV